VQVGAADQGQRREVAGPHRLLWPKLVMYQPYLLAVIAPQDVVREVEELAGQVADLLTAAGQEPHQAGVVGAASEVLDTCCQFIERWNGHTRRSDAFEADVSQLRSRLSRTVQQLSEEGVVADRKAS
jgi:hypothetical protein